jgi:hypothetical protein
MKGMRPGKFTREVLMAAPSSVPTPSARPTPRTPPLENCDRLTADEFERRYDAMPELEEAELIEGVVHMPSPSGSTRTASSRRT